MKPLSIHLQGFASHIDTHIDFTRYQSPIALCAMMGAGKTALIEGIFAALFGRGLWYGGSIYDFMTLGGTGKAKITLDFEHKGERYRIERNLSVTAKTQTQTAFLVGAVSDLPVKEHGEQLAGPKIDDFNRAIRALIGDPETASATWFLSQNRKDDLAGMPGDPNIRPVSYTHLTLPTILLV